MSAAKFAIRGMLYLVLVISSAGVAGDDHTVCMGMKCGDGRRLRSDIKIPAKSDTNIPVFEGQMCPKGIALPAPLKTLPPGHGFVGADKKQLIIPITDPEKDLQDGDVMLSSYNIEEGGSPSSLFFNGSGHAALVGTVGGKKYHLDSPKEMSGSFGKSDYSGSWTVLRLRQYPLGVNTVEELEKMKKDHPEKLLAWEKERKEILAKVKIYFDAMKVKPYGYNSNYLETKVFDKTTRESWREMLFPTEEGKKSKCAVGDVYCSELPVTGFALADETLTKRMPKGFFLLDAINAFDDKIFQTELAKASKDKKPAVGSAEWNKAFEAAWKKLIDDIGEGRGAQVAEFRKNEKEIKTGIKVLLAMDKAQRPLALNLMTAKMPALPVSPTDLWHDMFRPDGIFSYAGSLVGKGCVKTKSIVAEGQPDAGKETKIADPPKEPKIDGRHFELPPLDLPPHTGGEMILPPFELRPIELPPFERLRPLEIPPLDIPRGGFLEEIDRRRIDPLLRPPTPAPRPTPTPIPAPRPPATNIAPPPHTPSRN